MAENKFIQKLKGKQSAKSLIEIEKAGSVASFGSMPIGSSDAQRVYADVRDNAVVIANSAINWKIQNGSLVVADLTGDGQDYSGNVPVSGISTEQGNNLWLDAQYTVSADGILFTANTKWVLKLCGDNLINSNGSTIDFTIVLKLGVTNIITKTFTIAEQANFFNKELVIDFEETNSSAIKLSQGDTITLQLLSGTATASARIYTGMTVLSCLQRKITGDLVDIKGGSVEDFIVDINGKIIVRSASIPTASASLLGKAYQYAGATNGQYTHNYIYECVAGETTYDGLIGFDPTKIAFDYTKGELATFFGEITPNFPQITHGTFTYDIAGNIWTIVGKDSNENILFDNYRLYTEDLEDAGFVFINPPQDYTDGEVIDFAVTFTPQPATYSWVRVNVQPDYTTEIQELEAIVPEEATPTNKLVTQSEITQRAVIKDSDVVQEMQSGLKAPSAEFDNAPTTNDTTTYQNATSDSLVRKEQVDEVIQDIKTSSLTFIGYVSATEPSSATYAFNTGDLWLNSATMPTTFPFSQANIKEWNGSAWVAHSQDYTPANFDFFRNVNNNEGYYWFGGEWVVMSTDMSTTYFQLNTVSGKWEIKSNVNLPGAPTTTTPSTDDNSTKIATTEFTGKAITAAKQKTISNCITEIPQDIKLELNSGTLTLKAESKVYVPNGAGVFDVITVASDLSTTRSSNIQEMYFVSNNGTVLNQWANIYSGTSAPSGQTYMIWYDTANNIVKATNDGGSTWIGGFSLPVCLATSNTTEITSIDQVFNGFGYIGNTIFALPGVSGLSPNGRNDDGSLKTTPFTLSNVIVVDSPGAEHRILMLNLTDNTMIGRLHPTVFISDSKPTIVVPETQEQYWYSPAQNILYRTVNAGTDWSKINGVILGYYINKNSVVTELRLKQAFECVDYSDYIRNPGTVVAEQLPTANNNYTWFRKYSNGWVEQGRKFSGSVAVSYGGTGNLGTFTFPIPMENTNYFKSATGNSYCYLILWDTSTTSCKPVFGAYTVDRTLNNVVVYVCGMAAS